MYWFCPKRGRNHHSAAPKTAQEQVDPAVGVGGGTFLDDLFADD